MKNAAAITEVEAKLFRRSDGAWTSCSCALMGRAGRACEASEEADRISEEILLAIAVPALHQSQTELPAVSAALTLAASRLQLFAYRKTLQINSCIFYIDPMVRRK